MPTDAALLAEVPFFQLLDEEERAVLAQQLDEVKIAAGTTMWEYGDPGGTMYLISSGSVELFMRDDTGERIVLETVGRGEVFGELSLLDGGSRTASATAIEPSSLLVLDREDLQQLFRKRPDAALDMLAAMSRMTRKANALLRERVVKNVNEEVSEERGGGVLRAADWVANFSGSITFLVLHVAIFTAWVLLNIGVLPFGGFDPFPFGLLTMAVSLEAIILSTLLLFSSNRQTARDRIRSDIEYEINLKAELEVAHLHEKTDRIYEEMLDRFARLEKALNAPVRAPGTPRAGPR